MKTICISVSEDDLYFLKSKGISPSKLFRQTTKTIKDGSFEYKYV